MLIVLTICISITYLTQKNVTIETINTLTILTHMTFLSVVLGVYKLLHSAV